MLLSKRINKNQTEGASEHEDEIEVGLQISVAVLYSIATLILFISNYLLAVAIKQVISFT